LKMKILRFHEIEVESLSGGIFTGEAKIQRLVNKEIDSKDLDIAYVFFPPAVRNTWHAHDHDQCLWILGGKGIVASEKEEFKAEPGMAFFIQAGEKHWHGSVDENHFSHISIIGGTN
jgi:quercetin dioxygenase-like cupin family protein